MRAKSRVGVVVFAVIVLGGLPAPTLASVEMQEAFQYPDGNLAGNGGWAAHMGAGLVPVQVVAEEARLEQGAGSREDVNKHFAAQPTDRKTYAAFMLQVPSASSLPGADYFAHFRPVPPDTTLFRSRIYIGPVGGGDYTVGISITSTGTSPVVNWGSALSFGNSYRIVSSYDPVTGTAELWVDPENESSTKISSTHASAAGNSIDSYALRQATGTISTQIIDNLVVGTTFGDVVPPNLPSLSGWGTLSLLSLLMMTGSAWMVRRWVSWCDSSRT